MTRVRLASKYLLIGLVSMLLLPACQDSESEQVRVSPPPYQDYEAEHVQVPAPPAAVLTLTRVDDDAMLESYLKAGIRARTSDVHSPGDGNVIFGEIFSTTTIASSGQSFSGTNLQEAGVDEADRIKTNGQWLYLLKAPSCCTETAPLLRIMRLASAPSASAREQARLDLGTDIGADSLYLYSTNNSQAPDRLAVIGNTLGATLAWYLPWDWQAGGVDVTLIDVADPTKPAFDTQLHLDGYLVASRLIGDMLYLVSRHVPTIAGYEVYPYSNEAAIQNEKLLQAAPLSSLLPHWQVGGKDKGDLVTADNCFILPVSQEDFSPDLLTLTAIDLHNPTAQPKSTCLLGPSETLYASTEAIYLATTAYHYQQGDAGTNVYPEGVTTDLHKFALTAAGPVLRGSASVPGHLGWQQDKKPFRLGEYQGVLRLVTSNGAWDNEQIRLTTLAEQDGKLVELAHLPNEQHPAAIGKPGEKLYAVRFVGNRGFVVTFRKTDPLYVLDLSDPADPFIAGELQIAGYSDYLHPVSETRLLGIGKDAIPDEGEGDGRGAWYQGVKISLFDITDPAAPRELDSKVIGKRGTEAGVLHDHHALAWLPADPSTQRPARLALPIELHETTTDYTTADPWSWYEWTHRGLYLFDIDPTAESGAITQRDPLVITDRIDAVFTLNYVETDRAVITGNDAHYVSGDKVWSAVWGDASSLTAAQ